MGGVFGRSDDVSGRQIPSYRLPLLPLVVVERLPLERVVAPQRSWNPVERTELVQIVSGQCTKSEGCELPAELVIVVLVSGFVGLRRRLDFLQSYSQHSQRRRSQRTFGSQRVGTLERPGAVGEQELLGPPVGRLEFLRPLFCNNKISRHNAFH